MDRDDQNIISVQIHESGQRTPLLNSLELMTACSCFCFGFFPLAVQVVTQIIKAIYQNNRRPSSQLLL